MGPSEKSFNQVKSILGKLDRSIAQMREQRNTPPVPAVAAVLPVRTDAIKAAPVIPAAQPAYRSTSAFGRATPIPPTHN